MLCVLPSFAANRCDISEPTRYADVGDVRLAYQSVGSERDPALLLVMGLGGQLIHWPDEVVERLCQQGFRVVRFDNRDDSALMRFGDDLEMRLEGQRVASGIHYSGFGHDLRGKGGEVVLTRPTGDSVRCTAQR